MNPHRRLLLTSLAIAPIALAGCASLDAVSALLGNQFLLTQPQIQRALNGSFPKRYDKLDGLVSLNLFNPRLSIPQASNRLHLGFDLGIGLMGNDARQTSGRFALSSGLRFDTGTRGLHLDAPAIELVDVPALGGAMNNTARNALNAWLAGYARDEPVYRFDNTLLNLIGPRRVGRTDISNGQVVVHLEGG